MVFQPVVSPGIPLALSLRTSSFVSPVISCRSHERSSVCFLQRPWGVLLSSPFVITLCSYLRYQRRLRPTFSSLFSPLRPLYIPQIFPVRSPCFPFCVTSSPWVLSFVPLWETLLLGLSAFERALKLSLTIGDLSYAQNKVIHLYGFRFFFSVIGPLADVNLPYRTALKCNYGTCSCISRVFLRELGFTVFTILTGDLFAKFDERCWTTLICKLLRVEWVSEDLQYNRTLWSFFNISSTARTQSNEHVSSIPPHPPQKNSKDMFIWFKHLMHLKLYYSCHDARHKVCHASATFKPHLK